MLEQLRLEAKSDRELLVMAVERLNSLCLAVGVQNGRLRKLEDWRNYLAGGMTVIVFLIPTILWLAGYFRGG